MNLEEIARQRLHNHHLVGKKFTNPVQVVRHLGAMQAQDFTGAKWAIGQRCNSNDPEITQLFNQGKILRTHMLRPTWHFVAPEDIRWIQQLTAPRVHASNRPYYKKLELDEAALRKGTAALIKALEEAGELTRQEAKAVYAKVGIETNVQRLAYLLMYAELEAIICSGSLHGKQQSYALVEKRVPASKPIPYEEALARFATLYFTNHGPATLKDFAWWASFTMGEVRKAVELANLKSITVDDDVYYYSEPSNVPAIPSPLVHLLPNFDEYIMYKQRTPYRILTLPNEPTYEELSYHVIMLDGQLAGAWKRTAAQSNLLQMQLFTKFNSKQQEALQTAIQELETFLQTPLKVKEI